MLRLLVQAAWRRRWLLVMPVLLMLPVGLAASKFMPLNYVTRSLMLLQETAETSPLARETSNTEFITSEERLVALRALLLSDHVLGGVLDDFGITDPKVRATKVRELRETIRLERAGTNFIEIHHSGPNPTGLGRRLEIVMARFLEALVPDQGEPDAIQILLEKHTRDLASARATKTDLERQQSSLSVGTPAEAQARLAELGESLANAKEQLRRADQALELARPAGIFRTASAEQLAHEMDRLADTQGSLGAQEENTIRAEDIGPLREALAARKAAQSEQENIEAAIEAERKKISEHEDLEAGSVEAGRRIAAAQDQLGATRKRLESVRARGAEGILKAPELIRVVDPPRDPEFPTRSPIIYLLAALAAGGLLGLSLASIVELLDTSVRDPDDFSEVAGAPIVTRIGA